MWMCERESKCVYVRCGIKRVSGVGQASYGEADVGTYCPGLPHCTPERRTDEQQTAGRGEGKGRQGAKETQGQMRGGKREINRATRFFPPAEPYLEERKSSAQHFLQM